MTTSRSCRRLPILLMGLLLATPSLSFAPLRSSVVAVTRLSETRTEPSSAWTDSLSHHSAARVLQSLSTHAQTLSSGLGDGLWTAVRASWWCLPLFLCLVPVYSHVVLQTTARMPHWWRTFPLPRSSSVWVVAAFLLSNLSFLWSGAWLWFQRRYPPSLCLWIWSAGAMSTLFHGVQALGDYAIADALSFLDHGLALTAALHFCAVCGVPRRKRIWGTGLLGLVALAVPLPGYVGWHSLWHGLASGTAVLWAQQWDATSSRERS